MGFERAWAYMGTLAAMALMVAALGMGIYHAVIRERTEGRYAYYAGCYNAADEVGPLGMKPLSPDVVAGGHTPHVRFDYDEHGRVERMVYLGGDGMRRAMPGSRVSEQRVTYNEAGQVLRKDSYGPLGTPAADSSGVASRIFEYDDQGRLVLVAFENEEGHRVAPRMPGFAQKKLVYDDQGRLSREEYLDAVGRPVVNARGESVVVYQYSDSGNEVTRTNMVAGVPQENGLGYAVECRQKSADGRALRISWEDHLGQPVVNRAQGASSVLHEDSPEMRVHRVRVCAEDGVMRQAERLYAEHLTRRNEHGLLEWECYNAADGLPCENPSVGYAERVCEYDAAGHLEREYFWDEEGNPSPCYEKRYTQDKEGRYEIALHTDGSTSFVRL